MDTVHRMTAVSTAVVAGIGSSVLSAKKHANSRISECVLLLCNLLVVLTVLRGAVLRIGLCDAHRERRQIAIIACAVGMLGGLAMIIGGAVENMGWLALGGVLIFFTGIIWGILRGRTIAATKIENETVWISGVCLRNSERTAGARRWFRKRKLFCQSSSRSGSVVRGQALNQAGRVIYKTIMNWHYVEQGQQVGPVTEEVLTQFFRPRSTPTLVWCEGLPDWQTYHQAMANRPPVTGILQPAPAATAVTLNENEVVCAECGKIFPAGETIKVGQTSVCASCKPIFLQKLSEGARINTGELEYAKIPARFAAVFLDGLLLGAVNLVINTGMGFIFASLPGPLTASCGAGFLIFQFVLMAINVAIGVTYEGLLIGKYEQQVARWLANKGGHRG